MKIGVFDSGVGGESFIAPLKLRFPDYEISYITDRENIPYGNKKPTELFRLALPLIQNMQDQGCDVIVIACNTLSTNCIDMLRIEVAVPLVPVEPMVELAAELSESHTISVCATPATLGSVRYRNKVSNYPSITVLEPDCSYWASMIEQNKLNEIRIQETVDEVLSKGADVIVLGCTHYHWIEQEIRSAANGKAVVLQPTDKILLEVERTLRDCSPHQ